MHNVDFFPSTERPQHIQQLIEFLSSSEQLLLITGKNGTGKSSLLKQFCDSGKLPGTTIQLKGKPTLQPQKLTRQLIKHWQLTIKQEQNFRQQQLDDILHGMQKYHRPGLLIVDNAHQLPIATLAALMHLCLQQVNHVVLRIILLGEPELTKILSNLHHPDICIPTIALQPLSKNETQTYLEHILDKMGLGKSRQFDEQLFNKIYQQSQGIPAKVYKLLSQHIKHTESTSSGHVISSWLQTHWIKVASVAMLGFTLAGIHQYQSRLNQSKQWRLTHPTPWVVKQKANPKALHTPLFIAHHRTNEAKKTA